MAHGLMCASAREDRCQCSCGGALHGTYARQHSPGRPWGHDVMVEHHGRVTRLRPSLDGAAVAVCDTIFFDATSDGARDALVRAAADTVTDLVVDQLIGGKGRSPSVRRRVRQDHVVCSLLVEVVRALEAIQNLVPSGVADVVAAIVRARVDGRLAPAVARSVAEEVTRRLQSAATGMQTDGALAACRLLAVCCCPDPGEHGDVVELCVKPLIAIPVSATIEAQLRAVAASSPLRGPRSDR